MRPSRAISEGLESAPAGLTARPAAPAPPVARRSSVTGWLAQLRVGSRSARTRILLWQVGLLVIAAVLAVAAIREVLHHPPRRPGPGRSGAGDARAGSAARRDSTRRPASRSRSSRRCSTSTSRATCPAATRRCSRSWRASSIAAVARFPLDVCQPTNVADWAARRERHAGRGQCAIGRFETDLGHRVLPPGPRPAGDRMERSSSRSCPPRSSTRSPSSRRSARRRGRAWCSSRRSPPGSSPGACWPRSAR